MLELAILGLLAESPLHGYELRKRLNALLGNLRAFSYGSLYPALRRMSAAGWIREEPPGDDAVRPLSGRRARVVYAITAEGKERFAELLAEAGPETWEDKQFGVHFAFFAQTDAAVRLRILEGRRSRLEERRAAARAAAARRRERLDRWTSELQRHGLESVDREVRWLTELIDTERSAAGQDDGQPEQPEQPEHHPSGHGRRRRRPVTHHNQED